MRPLGHRVVGVVTSPGPKRRRSPTYLEVVAAVPPGVDVIVSNHPERWAAMLAPLQPDLIISGGFPWRIPADVLALPRLGAINLHDALLPRHRGPNATGWAFRTGGRRDGPDHPPPHSRVRRRPDPRPGARPDHRRRRHGHDPVPSIEPTAPTPAQALERVARGEAGEAQDESQATEAGLFEAAWRIIDWTQPARTVHNQVRSWVGLRDIPAGALGEIGGEAAITKTRLLPVETEPREGVPPGTVVERDGERLIVQCGDGPIEILAWSPREGMPIVVDFTL